MYRSIRHGFYNAGTVKELERIEDLETLEIKYGENNKSLCSIA